MTPEKREQLREQFDDLDEAEQEKYRHRAESVFPEETPGPLPGELKTDAYLRRLAAAESRARAVEEMALDLYDHVTKPKKGEKLLELFGASVERDIEEREEREAAERKEADAKAAADLARRNDREVKSSFGLSVGLKSKQGIKPRHSSR